MRFRPLYSLVSPFWASNTKGVPRERARALAGGGLAAFALTLATGCQSSIQVKTASEGEAADATQAEATGKGGPQGQGVGDVVRSGPPTVTYPGFEVLPDGKSVLTVQVSGPVDVTEQKSEGRLVYFVKGAQVPYKVNRLPIVTTNFATQVSRVQLEQVDGGANVIVELREPATPTHTVTKIEGGTQLSVTFPKSERFGELGTPINPGDAKKGTRNADDDESQGDGRHRRRHGKKADEDDKEDVADDKGEKGDEEGSKRRKRHERQVVPFVERHITVGWHTLAPDIAISLYGVGKTNPAAYLASGIRIGIIDTLEVEATPHAFRLAPRGAYYLPSVGATWNFIQTTPFDMGVRARFFIPADSHANTDPGALLVGGLPVIIHLGSIAKIDTGVAVTARLTTPHGAEAASPFDIAGGNGKIGLVELTPSPFYAQPGVPLKFVFQPAEAAFLGVGTGLSIYDFKAAQNTTSIPLGFSAGVTTSKKDRPTADFGLNFDWPRFLNPGVSGDKVGENIYEIAAWLRWYYYL